LKAALPGGPHQYGQNTSFGTVASKGTNEGSDQQITGKRKGREGQAGEETDEGETPVRNNWVVVWGSGAGERKRSGRHIAVAAQPAEKGCGHKKTSGKEAGLSRV